MDTDQIELRMRCLELAVRADAHDVVAMAQEFHGFAMAKDDEPIDPLEALRD